jgi:hypothetical protein
MESPKPIVLKVRGSDGFSVPCGTPSNLRRTLFIHRTGLKGDWWYHDQHTGRLVELEEAIYQWRLPQLLAMIQRRLDES